MSSTVLSKKDNVSNPLKVVDIMRAISNDMSLLLFETIAVADGRSDLSISKSYPAFLYTLYNVIS